jgi:hypothetical protein
MKGCRDMTPYPYAARVSKAVALHILSIAMLSKSQQNAFSIETA